jgi:hypothetical protein
LYKADNLDVESSRWVILLTCPWKIK